MALTDPFFWRAFVGPRFRKEDDPYFYDWTGLDAGAAFDPTALDTTTLDSIPNSTLADVSCADLTGWPQSGGVFFGPGGGGQG